MTKNTIGTPNFFREILAQIEEELAEDLDGESGRYCYAYAYGRLLTIHKFAIAQLEQALENARPQCRPGCKYIQGHSGPCIERDLDAEVNAGKWGSPGSGLAEFVESHKSSHWGCANAIDPSKWDEGLRGPDFVKKPDEEFVNVNHE